MTTALHVAAAVEALSRELSELAASDNTVVAEIVQSLKAEARRLDDAEDRPAEARARLNQRITALTTRGAKTESLARRVHAIAQMALKDAHSARRASTSLSMHSAMHARQMDLEPLCLTRSAYVAYSGAPMEPAHSASVGMHGVHSFPYVPLAFEVTETWDRGAADAAPEAVAGKTPADALRKSRARARRIGKKRPLDDVGGVEREDVEGGEDGHTSATPAATTQMSELEAATHEMLREMLASELFGDDPDAAVGGDVAADDALFREPEPSSVLQALL